MSTCVNGWGQRSQFDQRRYTGGFANDLEAITAVGGYHGPDDVLEDAVRDLLRHRPALRLSFAVKKYRMGEVGLNQAAELAGLSTEEFTQTLPDRGHSRQAVML